MPKKFLCLLIQAYLYFILSNSKILDINFVKYKYNGTKRIRRKNNELEEKNYPTEITGITYRFAAKIALKNIAGPTWLEFKHTDSGFSRWEIEIEGEIHERFKYRQNIRGWQIVIDHKK